MHISDGIDTRLFGNTLSKRCDVSAVKKYKNVQFELIFAGIREPTLFWGFKIGE